MEKHAPPLNLSLTAIAQRYNLLVSGDGYLNPAYTFFAPLLQEAQS